MAKNAVLNKRSIGLLIEVAERAKISFASPLDSDTSDDYRALSDSDKATVRTILPLIQEAITSVIETLKTKDTLRRDELDPMCRRAITDAVKGYLMGGASMEKIEADEAVLSESHKASIAEAAMSTGTVFPAIMAAAAEIFRVVYQGMLDGFDMFAADQARQQPRNRFKKRKPGK